MGRAAIRAVVANPALELVAVVGRSKAGEDAGVLADLGALDVVVSADLPDGLEAVAYMVSGDVRPDDAVADIARCLRAGCVVVTPSIYALYDSTNASPELRGPLELAIAAGGGRLFVSGIDPGWGNDVLPLLVSSVAGTIDQVRSVELFDYSTYDQPDAVRYSVGMGQPMDQVPIMVAPGVPTMIWGGQLRMVARGLGVELERIRVTVERRAL